MPDTTQTTAPPADAPPAPVSRRRRRRAAADGTAPPRAARPKVKKLRLFLILAGLSLLALISTVFGMMMAVASDLPSIESQAQFERARNSLLYADDRRFNESGDPTPLAKLAGNENRILTADGDISPNVKNAVIAIEDRRFYEHDGVDYIGIGRALWQDVRQQRAVQGGSTITQQFVKNALEAQGERTVFQKLRESAYAYHLERQWSKEKILTQYLNTVYFGNGAYGVESAMRTYFGKDRGYRAQQPGAGAVPEGDEEGEFDPNLRAARTATPAEAALLAAIIASPSAYDPIQNPVAAKERRDLVLQRMLEQGYIERADYEDAVRQAIPDRGDIQPPRPDSREPYFTTWVTQQLVDRYGAGLVFGGGLKITTTLDPELQAAAEQAIRGRLAGVGPSASLVAIENRTGEVKALVGGNDFDSKPFNLATNGHRQPGSAFKPFILVEALRKGTGPGTAFTSRKKVFNVPRSRGKEKFIVNNYENSYAGVTTLAGATATSDNSVYAELGIRLGTRKVARMARRLGVRTPISTNYAMTLGGLEQGLTPLEMAFAYSTIANDGRRVCGKLASYECGPAGVKRVAGGDIEDENDVRMRQVVPRPIAQQTKLLLQGVVQRGTGKRAAIGEFAAGKTGTTENYGDAWFVGFNKDITVAVWVGYPDRLKYMKTEYQGQPVAGGTYPAEIWRDVLLRWIDIRERREARDGKDDEQEPGDAVDGVPDAPAPAPSAPSTVPQDGGAPEGGAPSTPQQPAPQQPAPRQPPPEQPPQQPPPQQPPPAAPPPSQPPTDGGGAGPAAGAAPG